ncbi:MAG: hypothetical protein PWP23_1713 [Candidatus Sumerlaeota bacterium]|nr:hypothetical protein [Candidatus Sumerlaeota bacterium]
MPISGWWEVPVPASRTASRLFLPVFILGILSASPAFPENDVLQIVSDSATKHLSEISGKLIVYDLIEEDYHSVDKFKVKMQNMVDDADRALSDESVFAKHSDDVKRQVREDLSRTREMFAAALEGLPGNEDVVRSCNEFVGRVELVWDASASALRLTRIDERDINSILDSMDSSNGLVQYYRLNSPPSHLIRLYEQDKTSNLDVAQNRLIVGPSQVNASRQWLTQTLGIPLIDWSLLQEPVISSQGTEVYVATQSPDGLRWECVLDRALEWRLRSIRTGYKAHDQQVVTFSDYIRIDDTWLPSRTEALEYDALGDGGLKSRKTFTLLEFHPGTRLDPEDIMALPHNEQAISDDAGESSSH